jgi:pyruvate/2-oxoglutarate dehydrogenase complex dihydrolipoamide acyltransferase (E2) component
MRADGKKIKNMTGEYAIVPHIMSERCDSLNMTQINIPLEPLQKYINQKRKEGIAVSHLALIIAAYVRVVGEFPYLNRFIVNSNIFARKELAVSMVVLKNDSEEGTMSKIKCDPADTIFDINNKINDYVSTNRKADEVNKTDKLAGVLLKIPGLLRIGVKAFKLLDKLGLLPRSIIEASPFHATMGITNLASIRTNHIYHHIYNFGTTSVFMSIGNSIEVPVKKGGEIVFEKCMPFGCVMDERICSGLYYSKAFKRFRHLLAHPELLEEKPESVIKETPYHDDIKKAKEAKKAARKAKKK